MGTSLSLSPGYENSLQHEEDKCPACGLHVSVDDRSNPYLSENHGQPRPLVRLQPDQRLMDRFKIVRLLGNGSFGSVYLAEDMTLSIEVALKVAEVGPSRENSASLKLKSEMNVHSTIFDHKHIIRVQDLHFVPWGGTGLLLLSMEHADGGTFKDWLSNHSEDLEARRTVGLDYFKQACKGVKTIHDSGAIHLDLKPTNLLFSGEVLKVSDFGSARYAQILNQSSPSHWRIPSIEEGTPIYRSPEHFTSPHPDDLDVRADIYSLGIILFELLHPECRPPFWGSNKRLRHLHAEVPAPRLPETDEELAAIVGRCLEKDPEDRYQSVRELLQDLDEGRLSNNSHELQEHSSEDELARRIEETWERASLWFSKGDFNEAKRLTEEVLSMAPGHLQARYLREELKARFDQAEQFYEEIKRNLDGGALSHSVGLLQEVVNIYPDHPSGRLVQARLHNRTKQFRKIWKRISSCYSQKDFREAARLLEEILRIEPEDTQAQQLKKELREKLAQAEQFYEEIKRNLDGGALSHSVGLLQEVVNIYPDHPSGRLVQARLHNRTKQFRKIWKRISSCYSQKDFREAARLLEEILRIEPEDTQAQQLKEELREKLAQAGQFYQAIDNNLESGDLNELVGLVREARRICPNHPAGNLVQTRLASRTREFREAMEKGLAALNQRVWDSALEWFQQARQLYPKATAIRQVIEALSRIRDTRQKIDQALVEKNYNEALRLARFVDLQARKL